MAMQLGRYSMVRARMRKCRDDGGLRVRPARNRDAGGSSARRCASVGCHDELGRDGAALAGRNAGMFIAEIKVRYAVADQARQTRAGCGVQRRSQNSVGNVVAEGFEADFGRLEKYFRGSEQRSRGIDEANRGQWLGSGFNILPNSESLKQIYRAVEQCRGSAVLIVGQRTNDRRLKIRGGTAKSCEKSCRTCADNHDLEFTLLVQKPALAVCVHRSTEMIERTICCATATPFRPDCHAPVKNHG